MKVSFRRTSKAPARAVPVPPGAATPKPKRAAVAGFTGREGEVAEVSGSKRRVLLLGMGGKRELEAAGALAAARLFSLEHIAIDARGLPGADAASLAAGAMLRAWRFHRFLTRPEPAHIPPDRIRIERIDVLVDAPKEAEAAWAEIAPGVDGAMFARDLVAEPSNSLTPSALAGKLALLEREGIEVEILDADGLRAEGFGALLAVGGGSVNPPCLAVLRWPGTIGAAPVVFVGKGVTFDTGGLNLKHGHGMWEMRADMAGAAACVGAMLALARRRSPAPIVAVLPLAENMIGAKSYRPSDVLRTFDGTTVEIVDTDAEGRLILADALGWALARLRPQAVIDLATLTGSIVTALGHHMAGLFATDDALAAHVAAAGAAVGELAWRMPLAEGYRDALRSEIADLRHCSPETRQPDACHAAAFLRSFVKETAWVHLDIAGVEAHETASDRHAAGPTGWGVRLLDRLIADRFEDPHRA
ncbi:MAG: leucyl aminopeptidase family protein [Acetobacteraceae bacterium]|nr:leucyl aminopeptidase family protein [Acetobacteraceae bacterium]